MTNHQIYVILSNEDTIYGAIANINRLSEFDPHTNYLNDMENVIIFCVYLLKSSKDNNLYVGFTNNLERRIREHNNGLVHSTRSRRPFELIYLEGYKSEKDDRLREKNLKLKSRAFAQLKKRLTASLS